MRDRIRIWPPSQRHASLRSAPCASHPGPAAFRPAGGPGHARCRPPPGSATSAPPDRAPCVPAPDCEGRYGDAQHACERAHLSDGHAAMIQRQDPLPSTRSAQTALQIRPSARPTAIIRKASSSPWLSSGLSTVRPAKILTGTPKPWPRSARTSASSASSSSRSMPVCSPWAQTVQGSAARDTGWPKRHRTRVRRARTTSARFAMPHAASAAACFITSATSV